MNKDWRQMILGSHAAQNEPELAQALIAAVPSLNTATDHLNDTATDTAGEVSPATAQVSGCGQLSDPSSPADLNGQRE